jgi:chromosome partitioning protein
MADADVKERPAKTQRKKPDDVGAVKESPAPPTEAAQVRRPLRVVMSSPKGGSGKTGTCRNLAVAAALDGFKVATVDFDPQTGLTNWWQKRPDEAANIDHYAADIANVDDILVDILDYDIVFFDTATSVEEHLVEMKKLLEPADLVLVPTQETDDDLDSVVPWMGVLRKFQPRSYFVFNRVQPRTKIFLDGRNRVLGTGHPLIPLEIPDYIDFKEAGRMGIGVLELHKAKGREQVSGLWQFVRTNLGLGAA